MPLAILYVDLDAKNLLTPDTGQYQAIDQITAYV
jgi:hypothetical protein